MEKKIAVLLFAITVSCLYAGGDVESIRTIEHVYTQPAPEVEWAEEVSTTSYVQLMGGYTKASVKKKTISEALREGTLDDEAGVIDISVGYHLPDNIFMEMAYQYKSFDKNDMSHIYMSANYMYMDNEYKPYVGALVGYSNLTWNSNPVNVYKSFETTSESFLYGVQTGAEVPLTEDFSLVVKYQYMIVDHALNIRDVKSSIVHENTQNLLGGIKYEF